MISFSTERLFLKKIERGNLQLVFLGLSNPEITRYYGVNYQSFEATREQMDWYENLEKSGSGLWWSIRLKTDKSFCGAIGYNDFHEEHNKAEIGFWLYPQYWGEGLIKESAERIIRYLFDNLKIHRLEAFVEEGNSNSSRVLTKLGFDYEGTMKESERKNGKYISVEFYGKINR